MQRLWGLMPTFADGLPVYGCKLISLHPENANVNLPAIQGVMVLFDLATGAPICIADAATVTALRTAAASGLATDLLARNDVVSHGILGAGVAGADPRRRHPVCSSIDNENYHLGAEPGTSPRSGNGDRVFVRIEGENRKSARRMQARVMLSRP